VRIGIIDTLKPNLAQYTEWLKRCNASLEFAVLSHIPRNVEAVDFIDGLVLTGGGDVDPKYFGITDPLAKSKDVNDSRDEFEFYVIERALDRNLPVLGICRGMQVMNVYLGGNLILDLPSAGFDDHSHPEVLDAVHQVSVAHDSLLHEIAGQTALGVNSSHHQAVKDLGRGLMASALSADGVVEGAEWILRDRTPFLLLVQWHPERMPVETSAPASKSLAERFIKEVDRFKAKSSTTEHYPWNDKVEY
jgi:putative glutamine amidotransferase